MYTNDIFSHKEKQNVYNWCIPRKEKCAQIKDYYTKPDCLWDDMVLEKQIAYKWDQLLGKQNVCNWNISLEKQNE